MNDQDYYNRNPADDQITTRTPYDDLIDKEEPNYNQNDYRECAKHFNRIMILALSYILEGGQEQQNRLLGVIYALGLHELVEGKSMREMAREIGLSSGTISRNSQAFKRLAGLPMEDKNNL